MKIAIDVQTLFTEEKDRGIGRYTFQLISNILKMDTNNEYILCGLEELNSLCKNLLESPNCKYEKYELSPPASYYKQVPPFAPLFQSPKFADIDLIHITSPVMHNILIPSFYPTQTLFTLYDIIPLVFKSQNQDVLPEHIWGDYNLRLKEINKATKIAAISDCTRNDLIQYLNIQEDRIENISGGVDPIFRKINDDSKINNTKQKYQIKGEYLLTLSGFNPRKNLDGTLQAYKKLSSGIRGRYKLVVVCGLNENERKILKDTMESLKVTKDVIFTGFVSDDELVYLLNGATLFLFLSLYEGFGLPVAEAMACGLPVVASNVSSIPEICADAGILVDPENPKEIAKEIESLITQPSKLKELGEKSIEQAKNFNFETVAKKCIGIYESLHKETLNIHSTQNKKSQQNQKKIKVAYFSPLNPQKTGISDYSEELLTYLKEYLDIDIYIDFISLDNKELEKNFPIYNYQLFNTIHKKKKYDTIIYHLGNNRVHKYIYRMMQIHPSITVMHDLNIVGFLSSFTIFDNNSVELATEFVGIYGDDIISLAKKLQNQDQHIDFRKHLLSYKALEHSKFILVHNKYCQKELGKNNPNHIPIELIHSGIKIPEKPLTENDKKKAKEELEIDENTFLISSFGFVNPFKRVSKFISALHRILFHHTNIKFYCVGEILDDKKPFLDSIIKKYGLEDYIYFTGHIDINTFYKYIKATDLCINLRYPSFGETSATLLRVLAYGVPALVSNINQYKEFPDDCCWKVDVDEKEIDELINYVDILIRSKTLREKMGQNAFNFIQNGFDWETVSKRYYEYIKLFVK